MAHTLELYYRNYCPFSRKVMDYLEDRDIDVVTHCLQEEKDAEKKLVELGGKAQVPCLIIDGEPLYESDAIIDYLEKR